MPSSKSESNRALIIQGLGGGGITLDNLSSARDTQTMIRLLESEGHVLDVIDAGTTMRFLTAFFAAVGRDQILTGTPRMCQRPIGILVDALRELGAEITYWNQEGFPPLHIISKGLPLRGGAISMGGDVSSQFISAILMIAPVLPGGLALTLTGKITSRPYIDLTRRMMQHFGVASHWEGATVVVPEQTYQPGHYTIESDWSAASYWYSLVALSPGSEVFLRGLREDSWQGDQQIATWMTHFGVHTTYESGGVRLTQVVPDRPDQLLVFDCHDTPDLAQTLAVLSAATGIPVQLEGLHTLRVKETDRIEAIRQELARFKVAVEVEGTTIRISGTAEPSPSVVNTYDDHRMAMAFAPLALRQSRLDMQGHEVVAKSYPEFWQHLEQVGFKTSML